MTDPADKPNVIVLPPLLYVAALAVGLVLSWVQARPILSGGARYGIGGAACVAGLALAMWGRQAMLGAGTNINPTLPATALVVAGPFRFSRNPLYVALTLMYVGLALLANSLWALVLAVPVLLVMHFGVVLREERYLEAKFGESYRAYRSRVRRYV